MEVIEIIFKLAFGIGVLIVFFYILNFIMSLISKGFGTTSTLNGNVISSPDDYDWHIQNIKDAKKFITDNVKKYSTKVNSGKKIDLSEKILLLEKLEELKNNNTISIDEYNDLRNKLLNN
jgi:hypothetical protein